VHDPLTAKTASCRGDLFIADARRLSWWARWWPPVG